MVLEEMYINYSKVICIIGNSDIWDLPGLFIININNIVKINSRGSIVSYADDTAKFSTDKNWEDAKLKAEKNMENIMKNVYSNKLNFNCEKNKIYSFFLLQKFTATRQYT